jgi:Skp family chaperone for outer membrane proteins
MFLTWLSLAAMGAGQTLRIAVVDMTEVFKAHPETVEAEAELMKQRRAAGKLFNEKANELKKLLEQHQELTKKLVDAGKKASAEQKERANELLNRATKLEAGVAELRTTQERDLQEGFLKERRRILESITETISEFNSEGGYSLVLDRSAASANGIPQVLHAPGAEDVTAEIVKLLKRGR